MKARDLLKEKRKTHIIARIAILLSIEQSSNIQQINCYIENSHEQDITIIAEEKEEEEEKGNFLI